MRNSSLRPQLLFACAHKDWFFLFSSHQPQNLDENLGAITADLLTNVPHAYEVKGPVNGLFCLKRHPPDNPSVVVVIYNPSTRESITLPKLKTKYQKIMLTTYSYLGYDPTKKQFKVLSMTLPNYYAKEHQCKEYQVLPLGTERKSWRMIQCCKPHVPHGSEICINGVLYYTAVEKESLMVTTVVCFDISSEKFSFMKVTETFNRDLPRSTTMINYNGKLGLLMAEESNDIVSGTSKSFELRVLEDAGKHEWSTHVYMLPPLWKNLVGEETNLRFLGLSGTNEIVLSYKYPSTFMPSYVFYYNIERNTIRRLQIQGMEEFNGKRCYIYLNHVENIKLIQAY